MVWIREGRESVERCPATGKGRKTYQGFSSANIILQPLYHLHEFLWDSVQGLCNPVLPEGGAVAEAATVQLSRGDVCTKCSAEGTHCPSLPGRGNPAEMLRSSPVPEWPCLCPAPALALLCPVFLLKGCRKIQEDIGRGKTMILLISVCGSHLPNSPWVLISISVSYPRPV